MLIRDATLDDWPRIWPFMRQVAAAGETFSWDRDITEDDARDGCTIPEGFMHPVHGYVGLHIMYRRLLTPGDKRSLNPRSPAPPGRA
jgi:hypothetical protein